MKNSTTFIAFITALSLHLIIGAVMLLGLEFKLPKDKPDSGAVVINASMVNQKLFDDIAKQKKQTEANKIAADKKIADQKRKEKARIKREKQLEEQKLKKIEAKKAAAEKAEAERKQKIEDRKLFEEIVAAKELRAKKEAQKAKEVAEAKRIKDQKAEVKRIEAEKLATAKALKEKKAKEVKEAKIKADKEKAIKEKAAKEKAAKEKAIKEKAAKENAAKEAKRKADAKAERLRQAELDKQMEAEFADSFSSAQSSKQLSEIARYQALIRDKISRNWQVDPSMRGKSCTLAILLAPDGFVLSAKRSKGDQKLCTSAIRAAQKAKTLPIPKDPEIAPQFRDFDITLEPEL